MAIVFDNQINFLHISDKEKKKKIAVFLII